MTSRERILTALRGDQPDRVPMPLRMWKFLRKHCADEPDVLKRHLAAQEEFGIDIPDEDAEKMVSVTDAIKYLESNAKA